MRTENRNSFWRFSGTIAVAIFSQSILWSANENVAQAAGGSQTAQPKSAVAADLVVQALKAEADSQGEDRELLLKQALAIDPDCAQAHWQLGEVKIDGKWQSTDSYRRDDARIAKIEEYQALRDKSDHTFDDQMKLARWCAKAGLKESQQAHLFQVLQLDPDSTDAITQLGLVKFRGQWVLATKLDEIKAQMREAGANSRQWRPRLVKLRQQYLESTAAKREEIVKEISSIGDESAVASLEFVFANSKPELAIAAIGALGAMRSQRPTESLVRFALLSQDAAVRKSAVDELRKLPLENYAPILLAGMQNPIQKLDVELASDPGYMRARMVLLQEGFETNILTVNEQGRRFVDLGVAPELGRFERVVDTRLENVNAANKSANDRIVEVLANVTGERMDSDPNRWWNWWILKNEYTPPTQKPVQVVTGDEFSSRLMADAERVSFPHSCFVAGTPVWTTTGPVPIQKLKIGDCVLAKDTETGELTYKPILATTTHAPVAIVKIQTGDKVIRCTLAHPFWVSGSGWRMANELKAGDWLHSVRGPLKIDSITKEDDAFCYNLVVADFHDYFVGDAKLLVHDNLFRTPNWAIVPGLLASK